MNKFLFIPNESNQKSNNYKQQQQRKKSAQRRKTGEQTKWQKWTKIQESELAAERRKKIVCTPRAITMKHFDEYKRHTE